MRFIWKRLYAFGVRWSINEISLLPVLIDCQKLLGIARKREQMYHFSLSYSNIHSIWSCSAIQSSNQLIFHFDYNPCKQLPLCIFHNHFLLRLAHIAKWMWHMNVIGFEPIMLILNFDLAHIKNNSQFLISASNENGKYVCRNSIYWAIDCWLQFVFICSCDDTKYLAIYLPLGLMKSKSL